MEPIARIDREDGVKAVKFLQIVANSIQMAERKWQRSVVQPEVFILKAILALAL
jgi:hypothetical protein